MGRTLNLASCRVFCLLVCVMTAGPAAVMANDPVRTDAAVGELRFDERRALAVPHDGADSQARDAALARAWARSDRSKKAAAQPDGESAGQAPNDRATKVPTVRLIWPVRDAVGVTDPSVQAISYFLDQSPFTGLIEDWNCGGANARTYDRHDGLDIFVTPFYWWQMEQDAGIVVAAAPGIIRDKVGDQPERSCQVNSRGGDNNLVVIEHDDGSFAYYAHMRKDSLTARPLGARVEAGDYLGVIGSSGISSGPHLHFEVGFREQGGFLSQDPWAGQCNAINDTGWWVDQPDYHTPAILSVATHRRPPEFPPCPQTERPHYADSFSAGDRVILSVAARDLLTGGRVEVDVLAPDGSRFLTSGYTETERAHTPSALVTFSLNLPGNAMAGVWTLRARYADQVVDHGFRVDVARPEPVVLAPANNAYNGLWYDPALVGEGYNIVTSPAGTVIYYYGSDAQGNRLWLLSELLQAPFFEGAEVTVTLYESTGGTFAEPIPSRRGLSVWGQMTLGFTDCRNGSVSLDGQDGTKRAVIRKLVAVPGSACAAPSPVAATGYTGLWFDPALEGEGFNLVVAPQGAVIYYYGFDGDGDRAWALTAPFDFDFAAGSEITVELLRARAGVFADPEADALESWGTMTLRGRTCDRMEYALVTRDGEKAVFAERLVSVAGLECRGGP